MSLVTTSTRLQWVWLLRAPGYNEFGYYEHPATMSLVTMSTRLLWVWLLWAPGRFLCIKIIDCNIKKPSYNEHPLITRCFFYIIDCSVKKFGYVIEWAATNNKQFVTGAQCNYRLQIKFAKVMLSQASVILSMGGGGVYQHGMGRRDVHPWADTRLGSPPPRDGHWSGRYAFYWNTFLMTFLPVCVRDPPPAALTVDVNKLDLVSKYPRLWEKYSSFAIVVWHLYQVKLQ